MRLFLFSCSLHNIVNGPMDSLFRKIRTVFWGIFSSICIFTAVMYYLQDPSGGYDLKKLNFSYGHIAVLLVILILSVFIWNYRKKRMQRFSEMLHAETTAQSFITFQIQCFLIPEISAFCSVLLYYFTHELPYLTGVAIALSFLMLMYPKRQDIPEILNDQDEP